MKKGRGSGLTCTYIQTVEESYQNFSLSNFWRGQVETSAAVLQSLVLRYHYKRLHHMVMDHFPSDCRNVIQKPSLNITLIEANYHYNLML